MKEILPNIFAVEVAHDAKDFGCVHIYHGEDILYYPDANGETQPIANAPCHCDKVQILFTTKKAAWKDVGPIIPSFELAGKKGWRDFESENLSYRHSSPFESLQSLLRSHGLDENKNYLLVRKIN